MSETFRNNFRDCCIASWDALSLEMRKDNPEHSELRARCDTLYSTIRDKLGDDGTLIDDFDAAKNLRLGENEEYIYQQGFQDCIYLLRWMGAL